MKKGILVLFAALFLGHGAYAQHLYDNFIGPMIERCPGFLTGDADIVVNIGYDNNNTGLHRYEGSCVETKSAKNGGEVHVLSDPILIKLNEGPEGPEEPDCNCGQASSSTFFFPGSGNSGNGASSAGLSFDMNYFTDRVKGRTGIYTIRIPLYDVNTAVTGYKLHAEYAGGREIDESFSNVEDQEYVFQWDGEDKDGNIVVGSIPFNITMTILAHGREIPIHFSNWVGYFKADTLGFGSWMPSVLHYYDTARKTLVRGDGTFEKIGAKTLSSGDLMVAEPDGSKIYVFTSEGKHLYTKTPMTGSNLYTFNYDIAGKLTSMDEPYGQTTTFTYAGGLVTSITGPKGQVTELYYDDDSRLTSIKRPDGARYQMSYYSNGLIKSFKKPEGQTDHLFYDDKGKMTKIYSSSGFFSDLSSMREDSHSERYTVSTPMGRSTRIYILNALQRYDEVHTTYENEAGGQIYDRRAKYSESISGTDYLFSASYAKDSRFEESAKYPISTLYRIGAIKRSLKREQTVSLTDPDNPFSIDTYQMKYKKQGKARTEIFDGNQKKWTYTSYEGRKSFIKINDVERPISVQIDGELPTLFTYQVDGKLAQIAQGDRRTHFLYDENGFLKSITNALLQTTMYVNDSLGRVTQIIMPDGQKIGMEYDKNGNVISVTPPSRPKHSFLLNAYELLKEYLPPALGGNPVKTEYKYNPDKQLTQVIRPDGKEIRYFYNEVRGWNTGIQISEGEYSISYDVDQNITSLTSPDEITDDYKYIGPLMLQDEQRVSESLPVTLDFKYDNNFRKRAIILTGASGLINLLSFSYDGDDLLTRSGFVRYERKNSRGFVTKLTLGKLSVNYGYSKDFNELERIQYSNGQKIEYLVDYTRDKLGRIFREIKRGFGDLLIYDQNGRFIGRKKYGSKEVKSEFQYDENGNRIYSKVGTEVTEATYDDQDRLLTWGNNEYTYSENGDLETKHNTSTDELTEYEYDVFGNLKSVTLPSDDVITYKVDGKNRRVLKSKNGTEVYRFIYQDDLRIAAQIDASGNLVKRFVYGDSLNVPDYMEYDGKKYLFVKDARGSVLKVVDSEMGTVAQELSYDDWGKALSDSNPGFQPFGFAGGVYDYETGLVRFGARDYDAETGRWTSKDPIRLDGGDANLYGYALNDPINIVDSNGKWIQIAAGAAVGGVIGGIGGYFNSPSGVKCTIVGVVSGALGGALGGAVAGLTGGASTFLGTIGGIGFDMGAAAIGQYFSIECKPEPCPE